MCWRSIPLRGVAVTVTVLVSGCGPYPTTGTGPATTSSDVYVQELYRSPQLPEKPGVRVLRVRQNGESRVITVREQ